MNLIRRLLSKEPPAAVPFPEANFTYKRPQNMTPEQCYDLPCYRSSNLTVSCWRLSFRDRLRVLLGKHVWLYLLMDGHPPVAILPDSPFPKSEKPKSKLSVAVMGLGIFAICFVMAAVASFLTYILVSAR